MGNNKKMSFNKLIYKEIEQALNAQAENGSMPSGHNGPYNDPETPVRNTAHWLFTFSEMYKRTGDQKYKSAAFKAIQYLKSEEARPMEASFICRTNPKKDFTNGVIGQAWVMEALLKAWEVFGEDDYYKIAEDIFLMHPWMPGIKAWKIVNVEGSYNTFDRTFNHQLWFAATASLLINTEKAQELSKVFLEYHIPKVLTYKNGILYHSTPFIRFKWSPGEINNKITFLNRVKPLFLKQEYLYRKSAAYHAFNLYAFAILKSQLPDLKIWNSPIINRLVEVTSSDHFKKLQLNNKYSYPYNPTGIELAYALEVFKPEHEDEIKFWLDEQINATGDDESILIKGSADTNTSKARLYEAMRLSEDYKIDCH